MTNNLKYLFIINDEILQVYDAEGNPFKLDGSKDIPYTELDIFWEEWEDKSGYDERLNNTFDFCILDNSNLSANIANRYPMQEVSTWTIAEVVNILRKQVIVLENNVIAITENEFNINIALINDGIDTNKLMEEKKEEEEKKRSTNTLQKYWQQETKANKVE